MTAAGNQCQGCVHNTPAYCDLPQHQPLERNIETYQRRCPDRTMRGEVVTSTGDAVGGVERREVAGCSTCDFAHVMYRGQQYCSAEEDGRGFSVDDFDVECPAWCPLRSAPILITLARINDLV